MPVNSPCAPAAGWSVTASTPPTSQSIFSSSYISLSAPWTVDGSWSGWMSVTDAHDTTSSQTFGLYFMVHEPSG